MNKRRAGNKMKKRKILKARQKRVLAGILCAVLLVSNDSLIEFLSYAAEVKPVVETGITEEHADNQNQEYSDCQQGKEGISDGEEMKPDEEISAVDQDKPVSGEIGADSEKESDVEGIEENNTEEDSNQNGDDMLSVSENTESVEDGSGVAGGNYALATSEDDIASGVVDESYGHIEWVIDQDGKLTVSGWGDWKKSGSSSVPWYHYRDEIKSAKIDVTGATDISDMFMAHRNLVHVDLSDFDISNVTNMNEMFEHCISLTDIDLSGLDTGNVTEMTGMFWNCIALTDIDMQGIDTSNVTDMACMFFGCNSLTSINLSSLDTCNVTSMSHMFYGCNNLSSVNLGSIDISNVTDMEFMFTDCSSLISINLSGLCAGNNADMSGMFYGCSNLNSIDITGMDISGVKNMGSMFSDCSSLRSIDLSNMDVGSGTNMRGMFSGCSSLTNVNMSGMNVAGADMGKMFSGCENLNTVYSPCNVSSSCNLPIDNRIEAPDHWYRSDGTIVTELPQNLDHSVALGRNYIPTEKEEFYIDEESNHKYKLFDTSMEWDKAKEYCESLGGHLVTITSEKEQEFVTAIAKKSKKKNIWLGAEKISWKFTWITGEKFEYTNWNNGEPNNDYNNEDTIMMYTYSGINSNGYSITPGAWNDDSKHGRDWADYTVDDTGFICEWDSEGLPYEPEEPPTDIMQNDITVNGKGYAYANFILKDNWGKIQRNAKITYSIDGSSYEAVSDGKGLIALKSQLLENTTGKDEKRTIVVQNMTLHRDPGKTEDLGYKVTMDVTVTPLSFTQTWELGTEGSLEGSLGFGAGVTVGVANVEMDLAKAKLKGSAGGTLSVEHSFEDGNRKLILHQNYESKVAAKAKVGPAAHLSFLGQDLDVDIVKAGAGMVSGKSVGIGLKIDNYNPDDTAQIADIGKFMLGTQAQAGGDMMMLKLAERAGFDFWNLEQCSADISLGANVDAGSIEFGGKSVGTLASIGAEQMTGYTIKRDKTDSSKKVAFEYELASAASVGAIDIVGLQKDIFSRSDNHNLQLSANFDAENQVENVTVKKEEKSAQGFMREKGTAESVAVTYDREVLEEIKQNISVIGNFVSGSIQYILGDAQENLYKQLDLLPVKGSYLATKTNLVKTKADFEIGLNFGVGLKAGIGLEGVSSCEYETAGGTYEGGQRYITNTSEIEAAVKENSYSLDQLVGEPLQTIGERVKDFLQDNADKLINGVKNGFAVIEQATLGSASQWLVHIVSLREGKTRSTEFSSYEITAYNTEITSGRMAYGNTETEAMEYMAFTLGDPYYVYVTDESENEIMDYSAQPLTLELGYTDEMLTSAGFTGADTNNIAVYMYSQEFCGYVCVGGDVNAETKTVSVEITKPGQYVLAIDSIAPTVKSITISQNTNRPLIIVEFNEISGFREFSMKLDNEEVIATANWNKYYNKLYNSFSYQVERELTDGKHSCSVYAVDTAGNAMSDFYETEFYIGKATVNVFFNTQNHGTSPYPYTGIEKGSIIKEPPAPTDEGYTFTGWFKEKDCINKWDFVTDTVEEDITLYAGWASEDEFGDILPEDIPPSGVIPSGLWIAAIKDHAYTGKPIKPEVHVYDSKTRLQQGRDYTITYKNNVNAKAASATKKAPTIIVKGKGNYAGTETETFTIQQINLNDPEIVCGNLTSAYTSKVQKKIPAINYGGKKLTNNKDFIVSYPDLSRGVTEAYCAPGTYEILLTAKEGGNYTGTRSVGLTITKSTLISKAAVDKIPKQAYTGYAIEPELMVRLQNNILVKDTDYTVAYTDNKEIGKATAILTGIGDYEGTKKVTFNIIGTSLSKADIQKITDQTYNGSEQKPDIIVSMNGSKLQNEIDYTVTYTNNLNAGKATATITGINAYTGVIKKTFRINAYDLKEDVEYKIDGIQNRITCKYLKDGSTPKIELTFDTTKLTEGTDYTLSYKNNKTVTASETRNFPTMIIKGKGNFRGTVSKAFVITRKPLDDKEFPVTLRIADKGFADKAGNYISKPVLIDTNGKKLVSGKDYDKNVIYMRENGELLSKTSRLSVGDKVKVKVTGKGAYSGQLEALYEIKIVDFSKAKISIVSQPYTGREITLDQNDVTVKLRGTNLNYGTDYEILPESYRNNLKKGTAEVTIVGKGKYGGMKTVKFRIVSKKFEWFWRMLE